MSFTYDPYEILQVNPNSSLDEIKQAYLYVARLYHPDKGGDTKTFQFIQKAYKDIVQSKRNGGQSPDQKNIAQQADFFSLKQGYQNFTPNAQEYSPQLEDGNFDASQFNQRFREQFQTNKGDTNDQWTFGISEADYVERTKHDFERENAEIESNLASISRIFNHGAFDTNSFNRMFNWAKENHQAEIQDLEIYHEPEAAIQGAETMAFTEISDTKDTKNLSSLGYSDYEQAFHKTHKNPDKIDRELLNKFSRQKDITRESALSQSKLRQRMNQYNNSDTTIKKGAKPDFSQPIPQSELYTGERQKQEKLLQIGGGAPHNNSYNPASSSFGTTPNQENQLVMYQNTYQGQNNDKHQKNTNQQYQVQKYQPQQQQYQPQYQPQPQQQYQPQQYPQQQYQPQYQQQYPQQYPQQLYQPQQQYSQQYQQQYPQQYPQPQYQPQQQYPQQYPQSQYPPQQPYPQQYPQQQYQPQYPQQNQRYPMQNQQFIQQHRYVQTQPQIQYQQYQPQAPNINGFIPGQGGMMPPQIPMNSNTCVDINESVENAMMRRIQSRQQDIQTNCDHMGQQGYIVELNQSVQAPEVNILRDQVTEMQQTIDVQHKLLKKLANKQGYKM